MASATQFDPDRAVLENSPNEFVPERAHLSDTGVIRRAVGDTAVSLGKGIIGAGEAAVGLADLATLGRAGKALETVGYDPRRTKAVLDELYSPEQRMANANVERAQGFVPTIVEAVKNPSVIAQAVAESAPSIIGGGAVARGLRAVAPKVAPVIAGAVGEGVVGAGSSAEQIRQQTADRELTPEQAALAAGSGAATGLITLGAGRAAQKLGLSDIDIALAGGGLKGAGKSLPKRVIGGAFSEGVLEELPQSMQEQAAQNLALGKPIEEGVAEAGAMGMLTGGLVGGGVNVMTGRERQLPPGPISAAAQNAGLLPAPGDVAIRAGEGFKDTDDAARMAQAVQDNENMWAARNAEAERLRSLGGALAGAAATAVESGVAPITAAPVKNDASARHAGAEELRGEAFAEIRPAGHAALMAGDTSGVPIENRPHAAILENASPAYREITRLAAGAASSLDNDRAMPTSAQVRQGNYKKTQLPPALVHGLPITIENPAGSVRVAKDGSWASAMPHHYGHIRRTEGNDGDKIDVTIGPRPEATTVFVVDQVDPKTGRFDEHKVMLGFGTEEEAVAAYRAAYPADWKGLGAITPTTIDGFKRWLALGRQEHAFKDVQSKFSLGGGDKAGVDGAVREREGELARSTQALLESRTQGIQELRRARNQDVRTLESELRGVPPGHGATPTEDGAGSHQQRRTVLPGELPVVHAHGIADKPSLHEVDRGGREARDDYAGLAGLGSELDDVPRTTTSRTHVGRGAGEGGAAVSQGLEASDVQRRDLAGADMGKAAGNSHRDVAQKVGATNAIVFGDAIPSVAARFPQGRIGEYLRDRGGLSHLDAEDISGQPGIRANRVITGLFAKHTVDEDGRTTRGHSLAALWRSGELDRFLPPDLHRDTGAERAAVAHLRDIVRAELDSGRSTSNAPTYKLAPSGSGMRAIDVQKAITPLIRRWRAAPRIRVLQSTNEAPIDVPARARGYYHNGMVTLIADNIRDASAAQFVALHEVIGHGGLRGLFGGRIDAEMLKLYRANPTLARMADRQVEAAARHGLTYSRALGVEEALADMAGAGRASELKGWREFVAKIRAWLRELGFDLAFSDDDVLALLANARRYVEGSPRHAGSNGKLYSLDNDPLWYSALERAISDKAPFAKNGTIGVGQLRMWLSARAKDGTVKAEELKWSGLDDWLATQTGTVSRDAVKAFLDQNGVRVEEVELGGASVSQVRERYAAIMRQAGGRPEGIESMLNHMEDFSRDRRMERAAEEKKDAGYALLSDAVRSGRVTGNELHDAVAAELYGGGTKFSSYQLPGGKNYRELLLTLPREEAVYRGREQFLSRHFDQPDILAHIRFNERTDANGNRVLFIQELQSDWAQKGRKDGFTRANPRVAYQPLTGEFQSQFVGTVDGHWLGFADTPEQAMALARRHYPTMVTPSAPFVTKTEAWVALALKRMIRYAADNGFDSIAWTTGEQQVNLYHLSKSIARIDYEKVSDPPNTYDLVTIDHNGEEILRVEEISLGAVEEIVGKEMAAKIERGEGEHTGGAYRDWRTLSGLDLKVGGEGMRTFYDEIVPNVANDVLKKLGGPRVQALNLGSGYRIEETNVGQRTSFDVVSNQTHDDSPVFSARTRAEAERWMREHSAEALVQPGFSITPELRAAGRKPQALFSLDSADHADAALQASVVSDVGHRFANRLRDLRSLGLQMLGRRQIVEIYKDDLPQLERYNTLAQQMDAEKNEGAAEADAVADRWGKLSDERQLAELMHDATIAEIDPDKAYVEHDDAAKYQALRQRFEALTAEAQSVYRDARKTYNAHWFAVRDAIRAKIQRALPDNPARAKLLARMDGEFFGRVKGVYFPLARFGQYVIVAKDAAGGKVAVSFAETLNEAEETRARMLRQFPSARGFSVSKVLARREFNASRDAAGPGVLQELFAVLDQSDAGRELQDAINQLYLTSLPDLSWAKHGIHRKNMPGFSQDARRAFAQNVFHGTRYLAKLHYADQLHDTLDAMQEHVDARAGDAAYDSVAAQKVVDEIAKRHQVYMNPNVSPLSTALTSLGFVWHLGLSPASAVVNLTQTPLVAYPLMAAKWGYAKTGAALLKASQQTAANGNDLRRSLQGGELRAYEQAVKAGVIDVTLAHDLAGIAAGEDTKVHWKLRPVMKAASFLFHHAEKFNRQATFIAAFRLARDAGADHAKAYAEAVDATFRSHFDYSSGSRPRVMQGNVARVVLLFKQFAQNMVYTLARTGLQAARGDKEARKAFAGLLVSHALGAGILGLPIVGTLLSAASMVGGSDDEPFDAETALRNFLADALGQKPAEVLVHGLSRLTPIDISGRVGLDRLLFPDAREGLEGAQLAESWAASALGPVAGIGINAVRGLDDMAKGHWQLGLENMLPLALRGPVKALRYADEGVVDRKGIPVLEDTTLADEIIQALGFAPGRVREAQDAKHAVLSHEERRRRRRTELLTQFSRAWLAKDIEARNQAQEEIRAYNEVNANAPILGQHLQASIRMRIRRAHEAQHGYVVPRNRRQEAEQIGRFGYQE